MHNRHLLLILLSLIPALAGAQSASDYAVQLSATTQFSPAQIKLQWKKLTGTTSYVISKKAKSATTWSTLATLTATDSFYTDAAVIADSAYEYSITKNGATTATGYIYAAVKAPAIEGRGALILLVDSTFRDSCKAEIATLMNDLRGDGWAVLRHDVSRTTPVTSIKSIIVSDYNNRPNVQGLYLLGHIPVPYSGDINPDGHPDHLGAWPTDAYYADVNGTWTDATVTDTAAARTQNRNKPGDGKWDHDVIPTDVELQTGRVDFANMPSISRSEIQLMRNYLNKAHQYKMDSLAIRKKAVVDDNFGGFSGEAFAANAWRAFPTLVGRANVDTGDYETVLKDSAYQWAYGCGGGTYTSAGGVGSTADFNTKPVKGIFSMMFGSYFGDFDATNNFLRAPLCAVEPALSSCWAGRPNWFMHHMALGEPIGYTARLTQNNSYIYTPTNYGASWIHIALMGDPSLRTDYIKPVRSLTIAQATTPGGANISWTASPDAAVIGYYIYRADSTWGTYQRVSSLITSTSWLDTKGSNGKKYYMVRPVKLQLTPSGSYYNLGIGTVDSATINYPVSVAALNAGYELSLFPNPATTTLSCSIQSQHASTLHFTILNAAGQIVKSTSQPLHAGNNKITWNITSLPAGIYSLTAEGAGTHQTIKWIKLEGN